MVICNKYTGTGSGDIVFGKKALLGIYDNVDHIQTYIVQDTICQSNSAFKNEKYAVQKR
jgi:hypothetical protein